MPGFEKLYVLNRYGAIKAIDRIVELKGKTIKLKQNMPEIQYKKRIVYAIVRDENYKNRKVNVTQMIKNIFGRQKPIIIKAKPMEKVIFIKPVHRGGSIGKMVEQFEDGKSIGIFKSFAAAAKAVSGEYRHISDCCYEKKCFYMGYQWKFYKLNKK